MAARTSQLQIRITPDEKRRLQRLARGAGLGVSEYVLSRVLPQVGHEIQLLVEALRSTERRSFVFAELIDRLAALRGRELAEAVEALRVDGLEPWVANYVAALVEQAVERSGIPAPAWVRSVAPLSEPRFATDLRSLRAHLLRSAPVPFRRRNLFVDAALGDRI